jgi:hypothetical protein
MERLQELQSRTFAYPHCLPQLTDWWLSEHILPSLGELPGCTLDDLRDGWNHIVLGGKHPDFESAYKDFCDLVIASTGWQRQSEPLPLAVSGPFETLEYPNTQSLWTSADNKYRVEVLGSLPAGHSYPLHDFTETDSGETPEPPCRVFVGIQGTCTERFFRQFCDKVVFTLSTLLETALRLNQQWLNEWFRRGQIPADLASRYNDGYRLVELFSISADDDDLPCPTLLLLRECLSAIFLDISGRKDSMDRRIKNAVRLLVEAKRQSDNAVGLALSVAAIESLLCRKGDSIAQMFAEHMAVLLEPTPEHREAAERWCKKLYEKRSGIIHGSDVAWTQTDVTNAEIAAMAVLKAVLERRAGSRRIAGESDNPEAFLKEIKTGKYRRGQPVFVEATPLGYLWREHNVEGEKCEG